MKTVSKLEDSEMYEYLLNLIENLLEPVSITPEGWLMQAYLGQDCYRVVKMFSGNYLPTIEVSQEKETHLRDMKFRLYKLISRMEKCGLRDGLWFKVKDDGSLDGVDLIVTCKHLWKAQKREIYNNLAPDYDRANNQFTCNYRVYRHSKEEWLYSDDKIRYFTRTEKDVLEGVE